VGPFFLGRRVRSEGSVLGEDPEAEGGGFGGAGWGHACCGARGVAVVASEMTGPGPSPAARDAIGPGADNFTRPRRTRLACRFLGEGGGFFHL